ADDRGAARVADFTMHVNRSAHGVARNEGGGAAQLIEGGASQVEKRDVLIRQRPKRGGFREFGGEIKDRHNPLGPRRERFLYIQLPPDPDSVDDRIARTALPPVVDKRQILPGENGRQQQTAGERKTTVMLSVNPRAHAPVPGDKDRQPRR